MDQKESDPIEDFKAWALKLGCPVSALPNDAALNRLIKSNHGDVQKLMNHIRPRSEVKLIRDNLLLQELTHSNLLSERQLSELPSNFRNVKKGERLNQQISELKPRVGELRNAVKDKTLVLNKNVDQLMKAKDVYEKKQTQFIQLKQKHNQIIEKIDEEKKIEVMLNDNRPINLTTSTNLKDDANKAINKLISYLGNVYEEIGDRLFTKSEKEKVEQEIKKITQGIPVLMLFQAIKFHNENELKVVDEKFASIEILPTNDAINSAFTISITKSRVKLFLLHLKTNEKKQEHEVLLEQYVTLYEEYLNVILKEMQLFNSPEIELFAESICGDYLREYGSWMCNKAMLDFLRQKVINLQQLATERDELLKSSELVISELTGLYEEIEKTYNTTLDDMESLGDINKNMKQLQGLSKYTISNQADKSIWNTSTSLHNSIGSLVPSIKKNSTAPEFHNELSMLFDLRNAKWNQLPVTISMDLGAQYSDAMISPLFPLLTPNAALRELELKWAWYKITDILTQPLKVERVVSQVTDSEAISSNLNAETTKMSKLIEDLKFMYQAGSKSISEIQTYLTFLLDTSLGSFIPDDILINRRNFKDYEQEFLCACSIISNSMKKN